MTAELPAALLAVLPALRCPVCGGTVRSDGGRSLVCPQAHRFDVARQGFVTLRSGRPDPGTADTAEMVAARERFLATGHYRPIADRLAAVTAQSLPGGSGGLIVDLAGGTGSYLAVVLEALPDRHGVCLDLSRPALQRAARAHPRAAAIGADVWQPLPLADGCAAAVLSVFGPRNPAEIERVLRPDGVLVTVTPTADHLAELIGPLGMLSVDERKTERLATALARFDSNAGPELRQQFSLTDAEAADLTGMGPSAFHTDPDTRAARIAALPRPLTATLSVQVTVHRPAGA
ncbi:putative RNA methyltransferase [Nakamurella leprariae]|uniref:rRNA (Guanine-N1)-methyltransferase n=1 Tax=Nakamurella leprariae TaxID=2803911 RepID=A0A938YHD6_9ACTN|nr:methyltransferase domain-containing protein [Nakamurella leprariae]MBM9467840.1 rRNA (guanine-N1)-methyltransferase [Nakamurella leprariae]